MNEPAFPAADMIAHHGLTKLELFAAMAMQGFCANPEFANAGSAVVIELSIERSKALIAALEKEQVRT